MSRSRAILSCLQVIGGLGTIGAVADNIHSLPWAAIAALFAFAVLVSFDGFNSLMENGFPSERIM